MSVPDAAKQLGISRGAAYDAARRNEFPVKRIGKKILVPIAAFERWLNSRDDGKGDAA